jgi:predicted dehydrogenase
MIVPSPDRRTFLVQTAGALAGFALLPDPARSAPPLVTGPPRRFGLVGAGRQGRAIIAELQKIDGVELSAICDASPARLKTALGRVKGAAGLADHRALLDAHPDIEAIIVATPTHRHRAIVEDALSAGRHVYCEAPLASTIEDCRAIAAAAAGAKRICQAGFQGRSNPTYGRAQTLVGPELRTMVTMNALYHRKTSWRFPASEPGTDREVNWRLDPAVSTGLPGEIGAQQFDVAHWMRGSYPTRVEGRGAVRLHRDGRTVADTVELDLHWPDGVALHYEATLANSHGGQLEVFHGINATLRLAWSHGWLFKEADAPSQGWEVYATRQQHFGAEAIVLMANATQLAAQGELKAGAGLEHPALYYALADFVKSLTEGAPVACTAEEGARASIVGILANQAVTTRTSVDIPSFG